MYNIKTIFNKQKYIIWILNLNLFQKNYFPRNINFEKEIQRYLKNIFCLKISRQISIVKIILRNFYLNFEFIFHFKKYNIKFPKQNSEP